MEQPVLREAEKDTALEAREEKSKSLLSALEQMPDFISSDMDNVIWCQLLANYGEMAVLASQLESIVPGGSYILDIPGGMVDGLLSGAADALADTAGDVLASVFEKVGGEKILRSIIPSAGGGSAPLSDRAIFDLNNSLQHLAVQQQMASFASQLESTHEAVKRIESGLRDDRFGEILGARNQLFLASKAQDKENRRDLTRSAIATLSSGLGKLEKSIRTGVHEFEPVPKNRLLVYWKMAASPGSYIEDKEREYNDIKASVDVYREANSLLAAAYMMIDEPQLAEEVFSLQGDFWNSLDMKNVQSIAGMYSGADFSREWCFDPAAGLGEAKQNLLESAKERRNTISIEVSGQQLLEAMNNDKLRQQRDEDE